MNGNRIKERVLCWVENKRNNSTLITQFSYSIHLKIYTVKYQVDRPLKKLKKLISRDV